MIKVSKNLCREKPENITYQPLVETCKTIYLEYEDEINVSIEGDGEERYFAKLIRSIALKGKCI